MSSHIFVNNIMRSIVIFIVYVFNVESAPPEYCLHPLNRSDCNLKPTAVFSYYKSGSRCEIEYWRGCPTYNKFANEFECSDMCIFHFGVRPDNDTVKAPEPVTQPFEEDLKNLPEDELEKIESVVEDVVKEIAEEPPRVKLNRPEETTVHEPESTEPPKTEPPATEPAATSPPATQPPETAAPTTTKKESDESGLPDEVEIP